MSFVKAHGPPSAGRAMMREVIARAMWEARERTMLPRLRMKWEERSPTASDVTRIMAQAALDAISEAGFVIVPKEPTEKMVAQGGFYDLVSFSDWEAKDQVRSLYRAMIEASQGER